MDIQRACAPPKIEGCLDTEPNTFCASIEQRNQGAVTASGEAIDAGRLVRRCGERSGPAQPTPGR
jgi:hypothetical protein